MEFPVNRKKVLIITYYWPPSGGAGVQRWLKFSKYLREFGWEPVIYTPENPEAPATDSSLEKDIPEGLTVIRRPILEPYSFYKRFVGMKPGEKVNAGFLQEKEKPGLAENISVWLRGNLFIPDARRFWIRPSVKFLKDYLKENPVEAIVSTGPPHSMHLIALKVSKVLNIPWLADFRDPWTGIDFYSQLKLTRFADRIHHRLEKKVLEAADEVVVVSPGMEAEFRKIHLRAYHLITNGYDEDDFLPVREENTDKKFTISHIGSINGSRNPDAFWDAISQLVTRHSGFSQHLQINLIGKTDVSVRKSISARNLDSYVVFTEYTPHAEVMAEIASSQILLLLINNSPNQKSILTGKLFEYLGSGRPVLCIGPSDGDAAQILRDARAGQTVGFEDTDGIIAFLKDEFQTYLQPASFQPSQSRSQYSRKELTIRLSTLLGKISEAGNESRKRIDP
jgi:glycosyltransferase involved in cell wall biosynthesis